MAHITYRTMNYYPFNSRSTLYKSKIGAVTEKTYLTFRILVHKDAFIHSAFIVIQKQGEDIMHYEMKPCEYLEDYRFYEYTLSFDTGVYFYCFKYTSDYGDFYISKEKHGNGIVTRFIENYFTQTVYENNFKAPKGFTGGIIYQIFPDRFYKSQKTMPNIPPDRILRDDWGGIPLSSSEKIGKDYFGGNLSGIEEKLPYIKALGVTAIYLNPIFEAHSNHRYNTADYYKIDPLLGSTEDFISLCDAAHKIGIKIILDGVFSHTGDDSIYFNKYSRYENTGAYQSEKSPYRSWYRFSNDGSYKSWWGIDSLPETVETNPDFCEFICGKNGVLRYWLRLGADGWRLDVADELPNSFLKKIREAVKAEKTDAVIIGEVWEDATLKTSYDEFKEYLLGDELDSVMNYPFFAAIKDYIKYGDADTFCDKIQGICENYPEPALNCLMNHMGTHDTKRILTEYLDFSSDYDTAVKMVKASAVLQYFLPGIPSLFYGDEVGIKGKEDPFCRACYPYEKENLDLLEFYKELGKVRISNTAFICGSFEPFIIKDGLLCFIRKAAGSEILVAVNARESATKLDLPDGYDVIFGKKDKILYKYEYLTAKK